MEKRSFKIIYGAFCVLLVSLLFTGCGGKKVKVAYCNLSSDVKSSITDQLNQTKGYKFTTSDIQSFNEKSAKKIAKKYDLVFGWNGKSLSSLYPYSTSISSDVFKMLPDSMWHENNKELPVLLNHYGLCYSVSAKSKNKTRYPGSFNDLEKYLKKLAGKVDYPIMLNVGTDDDLVNFVGVMCESFGGMEGYNAYLNALKSFDKTTFFDTKIYGNNTIGSILNVLKDWQKKGYMHAAWYKTTLTDIQNFALDKRIGVAYMSLYDFRNLNYNVARDFVCDRMPVHAPDITHGLIAPSVVAVCVNDKLNLDNVLINLVSADSQKYLSRNTAFAPTAKEGQSYDKQADDVRFLAAACLGGPLGAPSNIEFESDSAKLNEVAEAIRLYCKK